MDGKKLLGAASLARMILIVIFLLAPGVLVASQYKTLHQFSSTDGARPLGGMIFDASGNLYGTTYQGGDHGAGVVFKLTPSSGSGWTESLLYSFCAAPNCNDGANPWAGVIFDQSGNLYGTTQQGGKHGNGSVFKLTPHRDGSWTERVLYSFTGDADGGTPYAGVIFDKLGNLYGTTFRGGRRSGCHPLGGLGCGVVFKLAPNSDGSWSESVIHEFPGGKAGAAPVAGVIFDAAGNLYGTTSYGSLQFSWGVVFQLIPNASGSWTFKALHHFTGGSDGGESLTSLTLDHAGNLYGTTGCGGDVNGCDGNGVVFELMRTIWKERVLHTFTGGKDGNRPGGLIFDHAGNLYGPARGGTLKHGVVFKLSPSSMGAWHETVLHAFANSVANPEGVLIFDTAGNLFGTTEGDGKKIFGSVFEITP